MCLKNRPTARKGFFEGFGGAGGGVVCAVVPPAPFLPSPAAEPSASSLELSVVVTCVCTAPAGACGTVAGASPALTAAGKGCCSAAVFSPAPPPGAAGFSNASATDIVCSG